MINLAVIELKDIVKYLIKITILIVTIVSLTKFFSGFKTKINIEKNSFLSCLDIVIPSIKNINEKNNKDDTNKIKPLKVALGVELGMMDSIEKNKNENEKSEEKSKDSNEEKENETDENIVEAQTDVKTEVAKTNVPEKYTSEYNGVKIKNETDNIKLTEDMLKPEVSVNMENILIYHTHSCESYTQTENYKYKASGNFRTKLYTGV